MKVYQIVDFCALVYCIMLHQQINNLSLFSITVIILNARSRWWSFKMSEAFKIFCIKILWYITLQNYKVIKVIVTKIIKLATASYWHVTLPNLYMYFFLCNYITASLMYVIRCKICCRDASIYIYIPNPFFPYLLMSVCNKRISNKCCLFLNPENI